MSVQITGQDPTTAQPGQRIQREHYVWFVDVSTQTGAWSASAAEWEAIGEWTEDASMDLSPDIENFRNILGNRKISVIDLESNASIPHSLFVGDKLGAKMIDDYRHTRLAAFSGYKVMTVWAMLAQTGGGYQAEIDDGCLLVPESVGGSSYVDMPIQAQLGGRRIFGTASDWKGSPTFTAN
jgi:hypothetical protein